MEYSMIFGKIDFLNLLPFNVFIKRYVRSTRMHSTIAYKKNVPSRINYAFKKRKINAAFISSIESKNQKCTHAGIVAYKKVQSVLVIKDEVNSFDSQSATSNALAQQLNLKGRVLIGDKALKHYLTHDDDSIDMATAWYEKHRLPFVFARLCYHKRPRLVKKIAKHFTAKPQKIPYYIMQKASAQSGIAVKDIKNYLSYIHYDIKLKEQRALKKFLYKHKK